MAGYSASKKHCTYLPMSGSVLGSMSEALAGYSWGKGSLRFAIDQPLPAELIKALVQARLDEMGAKAS